MVQPLLSRTDDQSAKGAGKKGAGKKGAMATKTPDGKLICFAYGKGECTKEGCTFAHVCQICFKDYPYRVCGPSGGH